MQQTGVRAPGEKKTLGVGLGGKEDWGWTAVGNAILFKTLYSISRITPVRNCYRKRISGRSPRHWKLEDDLLYSCFFARQADKYMAVGNSGERETRKRLPKAMAKHWTQTRLSPFYATLPIMGVKKTKVCKTKGKSLTPSEKHGFY